MNQHPVQDDRPQPFSPHWWRRRARLALVLAAAVAVVMVLFAGFLGSASEGMGSAMTWFCVLLGCTAAAAFATSRIDGSALPSRRKAALIALTCGALTLVPSVALLVAFVASGDTTITHQMTITTKPDAADQAQPVPKQTSVQCGEGEACGPLLWLGVYMALTWIAAPLLALPVWFSGLTAVPSYYALLRTRQADALRAAQAARRDAELKLSVLAAQIEPHFLFNTLANVRGAVAAEPHRAVTLIDRLADYLRLTIPRLREDGGSQNASLEAQFDIVAAYLGLMQVRLPRLRYTIDLPEDLRSARFAPLLLISLVENAVKHGIEPKPGPACIEVRARRRPPVAARAADQLEVTVSDDGVGFRQDHGGGVGLTNARARLAQLYGEAAVLELRAREGGGVCAVIHLPLQWPPAASATAVAVAAPA